MSSIKPIAYLFPQTSRTQTPDAPPYDPARKVKSWVDPSPGTGPTVTYQTVDNGGNVVPLTLSVQEASTLNLPGHPAYSRYSPAPTKSAFAVSGIALPFGVSSLSDAQSLAAAFGLTNDAIFDQMGAFPGETIAWDPNDARRCYGLRLANGTAVDVAQLLKQQNANGVGAPGEWAKDGAGNWSWKSELAPDPINPDTMPVPIVPLTANEHILVGPFGPTIVVDDPTPASTVGAIDLSTDPTARKILEGVTAIRGLLHV